MKGFYALKIVAIMMAAQLIQTRHSAERQKMNEYKSSVNFIASIPGECARIKAEAIFYAASTKADCIANAAESKEIAENDAIDILYNAQQNSLIKKEASECKAQQIFHFFVPQPFRDSLPFAKFLQYEISPSKKEGRAPIFLPLARFGYARACLRLDL